MNIFVADTGPLISWVQAEELPLLHKLLGEVLIPPAVVNELEAGREGQILLSQLWIRPCQLEPGLLQSSFPARLGAGEREAIAAAQTLQATLLLDDQAACKEAGARGIRCVRTLGLLHEAKLTELIDQVEPLLRKFIETGFWLRENVRQSFLKEIGEWS